jgi:MFS family permease
MAELGKPLNRTAVQPAPHASAFSPLREPLFRSLWFAAVISYTGTWMQNVGAGWLMTSLSLSPLMVSLVQAASSLPVFLVILPAGALADVVDRRRLLLFTQSWMVVAALTLGVLTFLGMVTPWILLLFTFLLGLGAVMNDPAWQAITPEIVSPGRFAAGVALNSAGFNVARAVGPALGGLVIAAAASEATGSGAVFLLNAVSFSGVIFFLYRWKRPRHEDPHPGEHFVATMRIGFQYLRQSPAVKAVLLRTAMFSFSASAVLALLPLLARPHGSIGYGAMLGSFGLGALAGAMLMPVVRRLMPANAMVAIATIIFAAVTAAVGALHIFWALCLVLFLGGGGWITIVATLNVSAQTCCPGWIRARTLSMYLLVLQGGIAAGSATWGALAANFGLPTAMLFAAAGLLVGIFIIRRVPLTAEDHGFTPAVEA